jgi:hypothetical protein
MTSSLHRMTPRDPRPSSSLYESLLHGLRSPTRVIIVELQRRASGCMSMVHHFFGHRFELRQAADAFRAKHEDQYDEIFVETLHHLAIGSTHKSRSVGFPERASRLSTNPPPSLFLSLTGVR